ncbi:hypothetical protein [Mucilaginibacter sp.]|uniref:hypothetical protein n=1 Tax=Mucilaginibacter sp. TaxID=1882438 RepID=UPI0026351EBA|nr:hypothetical protein [Mucilaginibacter sp.]MDB5029716.1 hypothetical protein [Mucilaginibacter sp.]
MSAENIPTDRKRLLKRDYAVLEFQAAVLYIKDGLSAQAICDKLNLSMPTIQKWNEAGRWKDLRPDMELLNEYKAAHLYVEKGLTTGEISQQLSIPETLVKLWIYKNGWDAAKLVSKSQNVVFEVVSAFCLHFTTIFPKDAAQIEVAQNDFIKKITAKN